MKKEQHEKSFLKLRLCGRNIICQGCVGSIFFICSRCFFNLHLLFEDEIKKDFTLSHDSDVKSVYDMDTTSPMRVCVAIAAPPTVLSLLHGTQANLHAIWGSLQVSRIRPKNGSFSFPNIVCSPVISNSDTKLTRFDDSKTENTVQDVDIPKQKIAKYSVSETDVNA